MTGRPRSDFGENGGNGTNMIARYSELAAAPAGRSCIRVRFRLEAQGVEEAGWQIYDPESGRFITEGEWVRVDAPGPLDLDIALPPQDGSYRIYVSPRNAGEWLYAGGGAFIVVDAEVRDATAGVISARVTTLRALRRAGLRAAIPTLFTAPLHTIFEHRRLIGSMVRRDILARYRGSFGDVFWTVLNPLLLMATYFFVFGIVLRTRFGADQSRTGFALYFLAGFLPWLAISEAVGRSPGVVLEYRNLVKKLVFPLETLPVNYVLAAFVTELFALAVFLIALVALRGGVPATAMWLPVLIAPQLLLTLGLCWFLAATGAYVRDLAQVMGFLLTLWFFITPICYPEAQLPQPSLWLLGKNPLFTLVRGYRAVLLDGQAPEFRALWKLWVLGIAACVFGYAWFHKLRKSFADVI
jgi:lipopolysaccharide transport system permease protein